MTEKVLWSFMIIQMDFQTAKPRQGREKVKRRDKQNRERDMEKQMHNQGEKRGQEDILRLNKVTYAAT